MRLWPWAKEQKSFAWVESALSRANIRYIAAGHADRNNNSIVMAACLWAGRNIQQAPIAVYEQAKGEATIIAAHPAAELMRKPQRAIAPDERTKYSGRQLISSILISAMLTGDAYVQKVRNQRGQVIALDYIPAHAVNVRTRPQDARIVEAYEVSVGGARQSVAPGDMLTFPLFGPDDAYPAVGRDPLKAAARQILTDNKIGQYSESIMESPNPRLAIIPATGGMTQDQADMLQRQVSDAVGGGHGGRALVSSLPATITPFSFSPDQMAIEAINKLPETRILAIYGIPPIVLQLLSGLERSTYSNMKEAREAATEEFLVPMWSAIADILTEHLLPEFEQNTAREMRFNTSEVRTLQEDRDALHKRVREDFAANIINLGEARAAFGLETNPADAELRAFAFKPVPMGPQLPQGPKEAEKTRKEQEK